VVRRLEAGDEPALRAFLAALPAEDRTFIKEDVDDPSLAAAWVADQHTVRGVAVDGGDVCGLAAVSPGVGWSSHVGELRLVVDQGHRRLGVGTALARWAVLQSIELGLRKLAVEVVAEQEAAESLFRNLGFEPEALLRDHILDRDGSYRDLLVLSHHLDANWSGMATLGLGE
jgi:GNAT superfamily N-acetyltransferase